MKAAFAGACWTLSLLLPGTGAAQVRSQLPQGVPVARITRLADAHPTVDGRLAEPCWKQAAVLKGFVVSRKAVQDEPARFPTEVYLLRDRQVLYVGARCFDPAMTELSHTDWFEVFVADRDLRSYYHFWVRPSGDTGQDGSPGMFGPGAPLWHAATSLQRDHWQVEMALPFFIFSPERLSGDLWRFNACRQKRSAPVENSQWSNTGGYFHVPERFGELSGMADADFTPSAEVAARLRLPEAAGSSLPDYLLFDRSYYTSEREARLRLTVSAATFRRLIRPAGTEVELRDTAGRRVFRASVPVTATGKVEVTIPLGDLADGDYGATARLSARGAVIAEFPQTLRKLPPRPGEVKVDRFTRLLLVDGKPFIPLITDVMFWGRKLADREAPDTGLEIVGRESGFQTLIFWGASPYGRQHVEDAARTGMKLILFPGSEASQAMRAGGQEAATRRLEEIFAEYRDEPNLLAWFIADEGRLLADETHFRERYARLKKSDPYHPVFRNEGGWAVGHGGPGGLDTTDIYCGGYGGYRLIDAINLDAVPRGVPSLCLQAWYGPPERARWPTPAEVTAWVYQVLIHGACGAFAWGAHGGKPPVPALWDAMRTVRSEVDILTPALATEEPAETVSSSNPAVHCTLRVLGTTRHLICVNVGGTEERTVFTFPGRERPGRSVTRLFEGGSEQLTRGVLATSFRPLERRVYTW